MKDRELIEVLKQDGRISWTNAARTLGLSRIAVQKRVEALRASGRIVGFTVILDEPSDQHGSARAFLRIRFGRGNDCFRLSRRFGSDRIVEGLWAVTGDWDAVMLVNAPSLKIISDFRELIVASGGIDEIETEAVLDELRSRTPATTSLDFKATKERSDS
ncbi:Lrp/AsnC family transcriptional regulator [Fulvimarina sp. 2208YS6-2-32]|uniref:Lrp/AsnC family transcriptional regulator n=1 Tax=Fulvimarina uroteuthidis TaxID=3098149 RepID=A0ABU5I230_9HYPH|nr:Lrp/AsnC family transcriptional regulator [Fulvimarina sp. 2208YS6-2-32]MDY8109402.1 Lrp/AsnC family transcriptional regulator [Fulvimarina sp. 2208YS6-2-32]